MDAEPVQCGSCAFWRLFRPGRGTCFATAVPENTVRLRILRQVGPGEWQPADDTHTVLMLTEADHFCATWQSATALVVPDEQTSEDAYDD